MARYRPVFIQIWDDEDVFLTWNRDQKLLFFYLITNRRCSESGIYKLMLSEVENATGITTAELDQILPTLEPNVYYDAPGHIVFVKNFYKYNGAKYGNPALIVKSIQNDNEACPTALWHSFIRTYPKVKGLRLKIKVKPFYEDKNDTDTEYENEDEEAINSMTEEERREFQESVKPPSKGEQT